MIRPKVWITRMIQAQAMAPITDIADIDVWTEKSPPSKAIILNKIDAYDGIISMLTDPFDHECLERAKRLRVLSQMAVGYDNIDVQTATKLGIAVGNTPDVLTETTADFTWALLLAASRRVVEANIEVLQGIWKPWGPEVLTGIDVHHATLGLIGMGRIGKAVAKRARGFDMRILYYKRHRDEDAEKELGVEYVPLDDLLRISDFISLHLNYSREVHHLINRERLSLMKPDAILINTARGALVDSAALYEALVSGKLGAAGLDVFDPEPILPSDPLLSLSNVVITPHIASASKNTRINMALTAVDNLIAGLQKQQLPFCVNPEVYQSTYSPLR